jgi:hypothetical protein
MVKRGPFKGIAGRLVSAGSHTAALLIITVTMLDTKDFDHNQLL